MAVKKLSIFFALLLFLSPIGTLVLASPVYAGQSHNNDDLKQIIELAHQTKDTQKSDILQRNSSRIKVTQQSETRVVAFNKELTEEEILSLESKYAVDFSEVSFRNHRYVVTPRDEQKFNELESDSLVKDVHNNDMYKVSVQTTDWGILKMNIPAAWNSATPSSGESIVVALLDTGVQLNHPDLVGSIQAGGHDFVNDDSDPTDDQGHGTLMAGAIVAADNTVGSVGAAYGAKILPMKVCDNNGQCSAIATADAIDAAIAANVDVINMSFGGVSNDLVHNAVQSAVAAGIIVVAAAGNENAEGCLYPAAYEEVVCVGSTTNTDTKATFSNYGGSLDVVTPGMNISSTMMGSTYGTASGTSISTAYYSGVAAVVESRIKALCVEEPGNVACSDIRGYTQTLINQTTVRDIGAPGRDAQFGYGIVDLSQFFAKATTVHVAPTTPITKGVTYNQPVTVTNQNSFPIALTACTVQSKNTSRAQTVPAFSTTQLVKGATPYTTPTTDTLNTTFTFPTPIPVNPGIVANFLYSYTTSSEVASSDVISYSFVCNYDKTGTTETENYRTSVGSLTTTVALPPIPATLVNVYFTFGKLKYNQTVSSSQLRALDTVYLKNYDSKKVKLTQFFLYDYAKKGNQGFTKTWITSTSFTVRTNYLLAGHKKYAYVAEFQDVATSVKIKKYFVFYTK